MLQQAKHVFRIIRLAFTDRATWWRKRTATPPRWDERNKLIAGLIPPGSSVLDLGAGAQTLKQHLPPNCEYQPCDLFTRNSETLLCDFNRDQYPAIKKRYDFVVCSGLVEYIRDVDRFFQRLFEMGETAILTYAVVSEQHSHLQRLSYAWVNHFTREELEERFSRNGVAHEAVAEWKSQVVYRLRSKRADSVAKPAVST